MTSSRSLGGAPGESSQAAWSPGRVLPDYTAAASSTVTWVIASDFKSDSGIARMLWTSPRTVPVRNTLPGCRGWIPRQSSDALAHGAVTVHATLLMIAITSPIRVSTPTITAAAIARPRRCRRMS